jgi:hypothetical protein
MRAPDVALILIALTAACGKATPAAAPAQAAAGAGPATPAPGGQAQAEAAQLGREIFDLVDRTMNYRSAHFGDFPASLPAMGVDSLTHLTIRRLVVRGKVPTVTVVFRNAGAHAVTACSGTNKVLEDSMLNGGPYTVSCALADGSSQDFTVGG